MTPTLATRYTVEVLQSSTATTPLTASAAGTIDAIMGQTNEATSHTCTGGQCTATGTGLTVQVPAPALTTQMAAQPIYTYFAIAYESGGEPPAPQQTLQLGAGDPTVSTPQQISATNTS